MRGPTTTPDAQWKRFESQLRRYVRRRVAPGDVDDVLGEMLLRLVRHSRELATADNATAWMHRVAANAITDHHRRRSAENRAMSRAASEYDSSAADTDTQPSAAAALATCLAPLVRSLPEPYREALLLTDIGGLTQIEAGRRLGISVSGMKSRVRRGRAKLKAALLGCCEVELDRRGAVLDYTPRARNCGDDCGTPSESPCRSELARE